MMKNTSKGFSLIELLVTVAVAAVVVSSATPQFSKVIKDQKLSSKYNNTAQALLLARSEAVKQSGKVVVCPKSANATACGTDWAEGLLVFIDATPLSTNVSGVTATMGAEDTLLMQKNQAQDSTTISAYGSASAQTASEVRWVRYHTDGSAQFDTGSFLVCDDRQESEALVLNISITGAIRQGRKSPVDDIALDAYNQSVSCT